jgi:hypothetical protein
VLLAAGTALLLAAVAALRLGSHDAAPAARASTAPQVVAAPTPVQVQAVPAAAPTDSESRQRVPDPVGQTQARTDAAMQDAGLRDAKSLFLQIAKEKGLACPRDLAVPEAAQDAVCSAYAEYSAAVDEVEKTRRPIVQSIVDDKLARGDAEHLANWSALKDPGEIAIAQKALKAARQPTAPHQWVIVGGAGPRVDIIRVNEGEDPRLPPLYARFDQSRADFFAAVQRLLASSGIVLQPRR